MKEDNDWWPSLQEYNPEIAENEWLSLLQNKEIFDFNSMCMMKRFLDIGGSATCAALAEKYGKKASSYISVATALAKRVIEKTGCKKPSSDERADTRWPVLFIGKKVSGNEMPGVFIWKLREELKSALEKTNLSEYPLVEKNMDNNMPTSSLLDDLAVQLKHSRNLILHGAPGTGKTYLAKQIAEKMGAETDFVQFHPSYDYTDFVEGLRPVQNEADRQIGFERKDGVFKEFCERALENLIDSQKSTEDLEKEKSLNEKIENFLENAIEKKSEFKTVTGNQFFITDNTEKSISVSIPENEKTSELSLPKSDLIEMLSSKSKIKSGGDIKLFFNRKWRTQQDSYIWILYEKIQSEKQGMTISNIEKVKRKPFIFIIDEINRGELSKIFGELFYAIDPGYRVSFEDLKKHRSGEKKIHTIRTQYANLETFGNEFDKALRANDYGHFFVPENVYIIGTMNDIDRSVDSMDFAFRRRFAFKEISAAATQSMLDEKTDENGDTTGLPSEIADEAKKRMSALNDAISKICGLPSYYHIGGAYFLKLKEFEGDTETKFKNLWEYHLSGLLREYLRGSENEKENLTRLENAYFKTETETDSSEAEE